MANEVEASELTEIWLEIPRAWAPILDAIAWPIAVALIALVYRKKILELIPRIKSVGAGGITLNDPVEKQEKAKPDKLDGTLPSLQGRERTSAVATYEHALRERIKTQPESDRLDATIYELAIANLDRHFWQVYARIFGSQIRLIRKIKAGGGVINLLDLENYFQALKSSNPVYGNWESYDYVKYLHENSLVNVQDREVRLSPIGDDFLLFLHRANLSDELAL